MTKRSQTRRSAPRRLPVELGDHSYEIVIAERALATAANELQRAGITRGTRLAVLSSPRILRLHGASLLKSLKAGGYPAGVLSIPEGEQSKSLEMVSDLCERLARNRLDRSGVLIALGGGVIGDLTGFVAATYLRGIRFVQVPTTLLACIDSSVGGKTGVDLRAGKNLVGAFHQPRLVLADLSTLTTLPLRQIRSGLYEAIKTAILADRRFFHWIEDHLSPLMAADPAFCGNLVARCCAIKADVVTRDERERDLRRILNLGHTFAHAIEAELNYGRYTHGEAVGLGLQMAATLSTRVGWLAPEERERIHGLVREVGPLPRRNDLEARRVFRRMAVDKKATSDGIQFVLPRRIGTVEVRGQVPDREVLRTLRAFGLR